MTEKMTAPTADRVHAEEGSPEFQIIDNRYVHLRDKIFAEVQKYHNSKDFIPVRRVSKLVGSGIINTQRAGSRWFSQLLDKAFENHPHYNCTTCRNAFIHMGGLVYLGRNGLQVNPIAAVFAEEKLDISYMRTVARDAIKETEIIPVQALNPCASVFELGGFQHFRFYTKEQVHESNLLGPVDSSPVDSIIRVMGKISAENLRALFNAVAASGANTDHLGGLKHFAEFTEFAADVISGDTKKIWITELLRHPEWASLRHFNESLAGKIMDMYLKGENVQSITDFYIEKSDPKLFKQKQAEAKEGLLKSTQKFLNDNEMTGVLTRRFAVLGLDKIALDWTKPAIQEAVSEAVQGSGDAVKDAFGKLINKQAAKPLESHVSNLADLSDYYVSQEDIDQNILLRKRHRKIDIISRKHFIDEVLPKAKKVYLALDEYSKGRWVTLMTEVNATPKAADFFNSKNTTAVEGHGVGNGLVLDSPLRMADVTSAISGSVKYFVEVLNVFSIGDATAVTIPGAKRISDSLFTNNKFPTIVGAEIRNEHYGMAAAIRDVTTDLGVQPTPEGWEEADIFAGLMLDLNLTFVTFMEDGGVLVNQITTAK